MEKRINTTNGHSGSESKLYLYKGIGIKVLPYFLYEISIHKYSNTEYEFVGSKLFKSDKLLTIKCVNNIKYVDGNSIEEEISLIGAPYQFIRENNLPEYSSNSKKLKKFKKK